MKKNIILLCLPFVFACKNKKEMSKEDDAVAIMEQKSKSAVKSDNFKPILGSFVGAFGDNRITFLISKMTKDSVVGSSVVGGNNRPFEGTVTISNGTYSITVKEPGDNKDDGIFKATLTDSSKVSGSWSSYKNPKAIKSFELMRKAFVYDLTVGEFPQASQKLLTETDIESMDSYDLKFMRNEIFARHGYCFKKRDMRSEFEATDWYVPNNTDVSALLTDIEKKNIKLIKRFEKYYEETEDQYGR